MHRGREGTVEGRRKKGGGKGLTGGVWFDLGGWGVEGQYVHVGDTYPAYFGVIYRV